MASYTSSLLPYFWRYRTVWLPLGFVCFGGNYRQGLKNLISRSSVDLGTNEVAPQFEPLDYSDQPQRFISFWFFRFRLRKIQQGKLRSHKRNALIEKQKYMFELLINKKKLCKMSAWCLFKTWYIKIRTSSGKKLISYQKWPLVIISNRETWQLPLLVLKVINKYRVFSSSFPSSLTYDNVHYIFKLIKREALPKPLFELFLNDYLVW